MARNNVLTNAITRFVKIVISYLIFFLPGKTGFFHQWLPARTENYSPCVQLQEQEKFLLVYGCHCLY